MLFCGGSVLNIDTCLLWWSHKQVNQRIVINNFKCSVLITFFPLLYGLVNFSTHV